MSEMEKRLAELQMYLEDRLLTLRVNLDETGHPRLALSKKSQQVVFRTAGPGGLWR